MMMLNIQPTLSSELSALKVRFDLVDKKTTRLEGQLQSLEKEKTEVFNKIGVLANEQEVLALVSELFKSFLDDEVSEDLKAIVDLQTEGLQEIFYDKDMFVRAETTESRGKVSVDLQTVSRTQSLGEIPGDPAISFGGSIGTIQGILLRISVVWRRGLRPVLILDETLKFVNKQYVDRAVKFLQYLCEKMGLDILLITHDHDVISAAKNAYRITYNDGKAEFTKVK